MVATGLVVEDLDGVDAPAGGTRGIGALGGASLELSQVEVRRVPGLDIHVEDAVAVLDGVQVEEIPPQEEGNPGYGMALEQAEAEVRSAVVSGCPGGGIVISDGTTWLEEVEIFDAGSAVLTDLHVARARHAGLAVNQGGELEVYGGLVEDTQPNLTGWGAGLAAQFGGRIQAHEVELHGSLIAGAHAWEAELEQVDCLIADTTSQVGAGGQGVGLASGSFGRLEGVVVRDALEVGVLVSASEAVLDGVEITGVQIAPWGQAAAALAGIDGAEVEGVDLWVHDNQAVGLATDRASLTCVDCEVQGSSFAGVFVQGATLDMEGGSVTGTAPTPPGGAAWVWWPTPRWGPARSPSRVSPSPTTPWPPSTWRGLAATSSTAARSWGGKGSITTAWPCTETASSSRAPRPPGPRTRGSSSRTRRSTGPAGPASSSTVPPPPW